MINHLLALAQAFLVFLVLALATLGWGSFVARLAGLPKTPEHPAPILAWLGWAFSTTLFTILHFFFPINAWVAALVFGVGIALALPRARAALATLARKSAPGEGWSWLKWLVSAGLLLGLAALVASKGMLPPAHYDTGLYYFNAIRWINTYPAVPGLVNLHSRLGFNIAYFDYVAALNFFPLFNHGRSLANGFLYMLAIVTCVDWLRPVMRQPALLRSAHPFQYLPALLALPLLAYTGLMTDGLHSPAVDLAVFLVQLVLFVVFARLLAGEITAEPFNHLEAALLGVLAAASVTLKLSSAVFSGLLVLLLAAAWLRKPARASPAVGLRLLAILGGIGLAWLLRGYVLSGAPFYPATIGCLELPWSVAPAQAQDDMKAIAAWARQRSGDFDAVLSNWDWLEPWWKRLRGRSSVEVIAPLGVGAALSVLAALLRLAFKPPARSGAAWLPLLPLGFALAYWFWSAPDPRFAGALFWAFAIWAAAVFLSELQRLGKRTLYGAALILACALIVLPLAGGAYHYARTFAPQNKDISISGWYPDTTNSLVEKTTAWGLTVYTPAAGDTCWDSPLPCTPYFNENLSLRVAGELSSGFVLSLP